MLQLHLQNFKWLGVYLKCIFVHIHWLMGFELNMGLIIIVLDNNKVFMIVLNVQISMCLNC